MSDDAEKREQAIDYLYTDLLEAYAAGFAKAAEAFDTEVDTGDLRNNDIVAECHFYYWDGRTPTTELWLEEVFDADIPESYKTVRDSDGADE